MRHIVSDSGGDDGRRDERIAVEDDLYSAGMTMLAMVFGYRVSAMRIQDTASDNLPHEVLTPANSASRSKIAQIAASRIASLLSGCGG